MAITGATKTKITYDANGLVTAGADATTADIADSSNKRYVTDADLTDIGNLSGTNTGDQDLSGYLPLTGGTLTNTGTTVLTLTGSLANANAIGLNFTNTFSGSGSQKILAASPSFTNTGLTTAYGMDLRPTINMASGTVANVYGILGIPIIHASNASAVTAMTGLYVRVQNLSTSGSILTNAYGQYIESATATGAITNLYGLYIASQNVGGTLNYAIYTNAGLVHLGDSVDLASGKSITMLAGNIITDTTTGTKIGTGTTQKLGFWNVTPIVQPSAFTQTYSTATKTHSNITATNPAAYAAGANGYSTGAMASAVHAEVIALRADIVNIKGVLNSVIDDLQAIGLLS